VPNSLGDSRCFFRKGKREPHSCSGRWAANDGVPQSRGGQAIWAWQSGRLRDSSLRWRRGRAKGVVRTLRTVRTVARLGAMRAFRRMMQERGLPGLFFARSFASGPIGVTIR
jgi:hypothetical protein